MLQFVCINHSCAEQVVSDAVVRLYLLAAVEYHVMLLGSWNRLKISIVTWMNSNLTRNELTSHSSLDRKVRSLYITGNRARKGTKEGKLHCADVHHP